MERKELSSGRQLVYGGDGFVEAAMVRGWATRVRGNLAGSWLARQAEESSCMRAMSC